MTTATVRTRDDRTCKDPSIGPETSSDIIFVRDTNVSRTSRTSVYDLLESSKATEVDKGMAFMRRLFGLLVLHYATILLFASLFTLIESSSHRIEVSDSDFLLAMAEVAFVSSLFMACAKRLRRHWARSAFLFLTLSVAVELGITIAIADAPWTNIGFIALGQITAIYATVLASFQFQTRPSECLSNGKVTCVASVGCCSSIIFLMHTGITFHGAVLIGLLTWAIDFLALRYCYHITTRFAPEQYILATFVVLVPESFLCLGNDNGLHATDIEEGGVSERDESGAMV